MERMRLMYKFVKVDQWKNGFIKRTHNMHRNTENLNFLSPIKAESQAFVFVFDNSVPHSKKLAQLS